MAELTSQGSYLTLEVFTVSQWTVFSVAPVSARVRPGPPVSAGVALVLDHEVRFVFAEYLSSTSLCSSGIRYDSDLSTRHRLNFLQPSGGRRGCDQPLAGPVL